jgi:hypothetical protein
VCSALFDGWKPGHLPLYWYEQQFPEQFSRSFKFTFVRDPLERAYSAYAFLRGNELGARDRQAQALVRHYRDFDDFIGGWLHPENVQKQMHFVPPDRLPGRLHGAYGDGFRGVSGTAGS